MYLPQSFTVARSDVDHFLQRKLDTKAIKDCFRAGIQNSNLCPSSQHLLKVYGAGTLCGNYIVMQVAIYFPLNKKKEIISPGLEC